MTNRQPIELLNLFDEKIVRFLGSSASRTSLQKISASITLGGPGKTTTGFVGPDGEPLQALALTLRFFIQDNEPTSLAKMRALYARIPVDENVRETFYSDCRLLNEFLDRQTPLRVASRQALTYREILNCYVFGDLAHSTQREMFLAIRGTALFVLFQALFAECLREFSFALDSLRLTNAKARQQLAAG